MPLVPWSLGGWTLWTDRLPSPAWPCPGSVAGSNPQPLFAHPWKGNHRASTTAVTRVKGLSADPVLGSEPAPGRYLTGADCWTVWPAGPAPERTRLWASRRGSRDTGSAGFLCQGLLTRLPTHRAAGSFPWRRHAGRTLRSLALSAAARVLLLSSASVTLFSGSLLGHVCHNSGWRHTLLESQ